MSCRYSFGKSKKTQWLFSDFIQFRDFIVNKLNKEAILEEDLLSRTTLWRRFKPFFNYSSVPEDSLFLLAEAGIMNDVFGWALGIDGKWLHRQGAVMIYRNITKSTNLYWSWHPSESYDSIREDFIHLLPIIRPYMPVGVVSDWKGAIVASVNEFLPPIPHQRCLAHVQRQLLTFLPLRSPLVMTRRLREIAKNITTIYSHEEMAVWIQAVQSWTYTYQHFLQEKTKDTHTKKKWWYTHGNLRRAVKLLTFDKAHLFAYLENQLLPSTNNSLEGGNSQMKTKLSNHRGMKTPQQVIYIFWLLTFRRVKNKKNLKRLWDRLKPKIFRY